MTKNPPVQLHVCQWMAHNGCIRVCTRVRSTFLVSKSQAAPIGRAVTSLITAAGQVSYGAQSQPRTTALERLRRADGTQDDYAGVCSEESMLAYAVQGAVSCWHADQVGGSRDSDRGRGKRRCTWPRPCYSMTHCRCARARGLTVFPGCLSFYDFMTLSQWRRHLARACEHFHGT